jgi:hypothetical protein
MVHSKRPAALLPVAQPSARLRSAARRLSICVAALGLGAVLMGAGSAQHRPGVAIAPHPLDGASATAQLPLTPDPSMSLNPLVNVNGILASAITSPLPTPSSSSRATPTPFESVGGATSGPGATAPPTSVAALPFGPGGSTPLLFLLVALALGVGGVVYARHRRRRLIATSWRGGLSGR